MFVDPITRQTFDFAEEIACSGGTENAFQLDMDAPNTWYQLIPEPVHFKSPKHLSHIQSATSHHSQITTLNARDCIPRDNLRTFGIMLSIMLHRSQF